MVAWVLASACALGHVGHVWQGAPRWLHFLGSTAVHGVMSALALVGPGRQIIAEGFQALKRNAPGTGTLEHTRARSRGQGMADRMGLLPLRVHCSW